VADKEEPNDYDYVTKMADRLKLKGKDRETYIHDHMTGLGYKAKVSYAKDDEGDGDNVRRFGLGSRRTGSDDW
jgi:hypothetical protein